jgi:hypothetical protein
MEQQMKSNKKAIKETNTTDNQYKYSDFAGYLTFAEYMTKIGKPLRGTILADAMGAALMLIGQSARKITVLRRGEDSMQPIFTEEELKRFVSFYNANPNWVEHAKWEWKREKHFDWKGTPDSLLTLDEVTLSGNSYDCECGNEVFCDCYNSDENLDVRMVNFSSMLESLHESFQLTRSLRIIVDPKTSTVIECPQYPEWLLQTAKKVLDMREKKAIVKNVVAGAQVGMTVI